MATNTVTPIPTMVVLVKKNNKTRQKARYNKHHKTKIVTLFDSFNEKAKELHREDMENIEKWSTEVNTFNFTLIVIKRLLCNGKEI